ncbi:MAG: DedA family protein [Ruminococcus sp.]|nr:DedA family protein [Ruminococcus sp.]
MQAVMLHIMNKYGYLGVCFLIAVENLFPPIPSEVILPFTGFMTTYTRMTVLGAVIFSTIGSMIGAVILYRIGMALTPQKLSALFEKKWVKMLGFEKEDLEKTLAWFEKRGKKAILLGRCVPIIRSLISIPAGMAEMNLAQFYVYTLIGSTIWNILLISLGAILGASWELISVYVSRYSTVIKVGLFIAAAVLIYRYVKKKAGGKKT